MEIEKYTGPISKLIEVVSNSIGVLYEGKRIERKAKAEANAKIYTRIGEIIAKELDERAIMRIINKENNRQLNIDAIVKYSIVEMGGKEDLTSDEHPDPDWITEFFNLSQDVSNKDLQKIWGKILANEVDKPGAFSRRTMHALKLISANEAAWFNKFCENIISIYVEGDQPYYCVMNNLFKVGDKFSYEISGVSGYQLHKLEEIGLVSSMSFDFSDSDPFDIGISNKRYQSIESENFELDTNSLTVIGEDLYANILVTPNTEFLKECENYLLSHKMVIANA